MNNVQIERAGLKAWPAFEEFDDNGASSSYLQVVAENTPAVGFYKKLGYEPAYEYHYKIQNYA
jgi:ribosomal protein S18 acetylase RimI-like enzyme